MRVRKLVAIVVALALGACLTNPDPRKPSVEMMQKRSFGGWIVVVQRDGGMHAGELISVDSGVVRVLGPRGMSVVPMPVIASASLYQYEYEGGLGAWGLLGGLSTISHGFILILSFPIWMISTGVTAGAESRHIRMEYPDRSWAALGKWARFPQGMPMGMDPRALVTPRAAMPAPVAPPPPAPAPAPPATVPPPVPTKPPPAQPWPPPAPPRR
jgi:hypothetical protein